ncbi:MULTISPECIES: FHA domain-containing protein FhaB/FipA [Corynebacterium]|uniref:FHA domain-containing protein FhaB/FipA n=1 Tax=Corynebacterium TaxID=1716 RepID=UPI00124F0055|nr:MULTISPECIES: FHA domain-containing protein [Corynebacterium]
MSAVILLVFRIGLLVLLWLCIFFALRAMRRDTNRLAGTQSSGRFWSKRSPATAPAGAPRKRPQPPAQLVVVDGAMRGSRMDLLGVQEITIGRSQECTFVIQDDFASSRHARLFRRGDDWFVEDLDSRNGTHVGGYRIDQPEKITTESEVTIGRTTVRLMP